MAIVKTLTYVYHPAPADPVGFQMTFAAYDTANGGTAGQVFTTTLVIDPANCTYWSTSLAHGTQTAGIPAGMPVPVISYDPNGITATWTSRISNQAAAPTTFALRGRFNGGGLVQIQAVCTQMSDPTNTGSAQLTVPIPA